MAENELENALKDLDINKFSPMMQHYISTRRKYPDSILFYRLGDFYEMFFDDAIRVSRELELTLTGKDCGQEERAPMCGIPYHAAEGYICKLVEKGYKVAICEQLEDPKQAKGIVKRDVIKVITPGTIVDGSLLEEKKNNYIMSIYKEGIYFGVAICDISTGDFYATEIKEDNNFAKLLDEISRYNPSELVINQMLADSTEEVNEIKQRFNTYISKENEEVFSQESKNIKSTFDVVDKDGNEYKDFDKHLFVISAINGLMNYIEDTQKERPDNLNKITIYEATKYMALDINARRNLELTEKLRDKSKKGTLLWVLDKTSTSMGGRLLRRWISDPLVDVNDIQNRLGAVKELKENDILRDDVINSLKNVYDIERYERLREIAAEIIEEKSNISLEKVKDLFCNENGYQTPKIDTRAAIFKDEKILLTHENNGTWSLPGGWCDVLESVASNTIKEVKEETGLDVETIKIIAVQDRNKHNKPIYAYGVCKIFVLCNVIGGEFIENIETTEIKYFSLDEIPNNLAEEKTNNEQIEMCFKAYKDEKWQTQFD